MDCCDNKNICINCGFIHDYQYVNEISFKDYNMNMLNILFHKKTIYMRKKYLYKKCLHIKEINDNIILFFDNSLENIRKLYNEKNFYIKIFKFYILFLSIKVQLNINRFLRIKKIINLNDDIIEILERIV